MVVVPHWNVSGGVRVMDIIPRHAHTYTCMNVRVGSSSGMSDRPADAVVVVVVRVVVDGPLMMMRIEPYIIPIGPSFPGERDARAFLDYFQDAQVFEIGEDVCAEGYCEVLCERCD